MESAGTANGKRRFKIIYLEITNACNFTCDYCPIDQQSRNYGLFGRLDWEGTLAGRRADAYAGAWLRTGGSSTASLRSSAIRAIHRAAA